METITRSGEIISVVPAAHSTPLTLIIRNDANAPYAMDTPHGRTQGYSDLRRLRAAMMFVFGVADARVRRSEQKPNWHIASKTLE